MAIGLKGVKWSKAQKAQARITRAKNKRLKASADKVIGLANAVPKRTTFVPVPVRAADPNYARVVGQEKILDFEVKAGSDMRVTVGEYVVRIRAIT